MEVDVIYCRMFFCASERSEKCEWRPLEFIYERTMTFIFNAGTQLKNGLRGTWSRIEPVLPVKMRALNAANLHVGRKTFTYSILSKFKINCCIVLQLSTNVFLHLIDFVWLEYPETMKSD